MNKKRILYAEDERDLRELTTEILSSEGYDCVAVNDGVEAKEILKQEHFDLLLTDFNMPTVDGTELLFWCREQGLYLPVIFITGSPELIPIQKKAMTDTSASLVHKPFNFRILIQAIEEALEKANTLQSKNLY